MFAPGHIHYERWLTSHIGELLPLVVKNWEIHESFVNGYFRISKSKKNFLKALEQSSKLVKVDGGAIGIWKMKQHF